MKKVILLTLLVASLCACDNSHGDMYDPTWVREQYQNQWEMQFGEIAPDQNWNMAKKIEANLAIQEDALTDYTLKVYSADPLYDKGAKLIAKTKVTTNAEGFAQTSLTFDVLTTSKNIYVVRVDENGRRLMKGYEVKDNTLDVRFGATVSSRAIEEGDLPTMPCPYTIAQVDSMIANGYDISKGLEYANQWGGISTVQKFMELPLAENNKNGSLIAVITTSFDKFPTEVSNVCYVQGDSVFGWKNNLPNQFLGYSTKEKSINPGDIKMVITKGGVYKHKGGNVTNMDIIVADGGVMEIEATLNTWNNCRVIVMPGGKVVDKSTYHFSINNDSGSSMVYIAGTMENIRFYQLNSGQTYIAETGVFTGKQISFVNSDCVLTNWGKIDVDLIGNGDDGRLGTLNNGCLLRSKEKIQVSILNMNANTAVECNLILVDFLTMRNNSILRSKTLDFGSGGALIEYVGTSDASALVSSDLIKLNIQAVVKGNVYVEANEYINKSFIENSGASLSKVGESKFAIFPAYKGDELEKADCTGRGNIPTNYVPEQKDDTQSWIVACEDLGAVGDFDFNDIVFRVSHLAGNDTVHIQALAAGGTLQAVLCHETAGELGEIHGLFGFTDVTMMVNTGVGYNWNGRNNYNGKVIDIKAPTDFTMATNMGGFYLKIYNGDKEVETEIGPSQGVAPQMICAPGDWKWPLEVVNIGDAYPGFGEWGAGYEAGGTWYEGGVAENLYDENIIY